MASLYWKTPYWLRAFLTFFVVGYCTSVVLRHLGLDGDEGTLDEIVRVSTFGVAAGVVAGVTVYAERRHRESGRK
jgi:hypothetical protein